MSKKERVPIIEDLFTYLTDDPRIIANRCKKCGTISFPKLPFCHNPDCCEKVRDNVEEIQLSKRGKLWTYTVQVYAPPLPFKMDPFEPFAVGMVDFPEGLRMIGMLTRKDNLKIGMEVETTVGRLYEDGENEYITYMFAPVA